ncbi:MAG: hypothetical protein HGGPFJEG_01931 [Ignavibacteria bacterium]|nr:hypothetical protein [Ignavibacteria bacterium]
MFIKEIFLYTSDPESLKKFYIDKLGFNLINFSREELSFEAGESIVRFIQIRDSVKPFYHFAFNIPSNIFLEAKEWIKSKDIMLIPLNGEDEFNFISWNAHSFYFYDAAGNIVEFIARHNLRNDTFKKFDIESIINVSEIGLPVKDVGNTFQLLNEKLSIPHFSGDMKTFEAAGNEDGLLIIVNEGRKWFPDCQEAEIFQLKIILNTGAVMNLPLEDGKYIISSA